MRDVSESRDEFVKKIIYEAPDTPSNYESDIQIKHTSYCLSLCFSVNTYFRWKS